MTRDTTSDLQKASRRQYLRKLSALGVSATSLRYLTKDRLQSVTDDPADEVPVLQFLKYTGKAEEGSSDPIGRQPIYKTEPRDEWIRVEGVFEAARSLRADPAVGGRDGVTVGVTRTTRNQRRELAVEIVHRTVETSDGVVSSPVISFTDLESMAPAETSSHVGSGRRKRQIEGIPVEVRQRREKLLAYDKKYRPVPAGCQHTTDDAVCTIGTPAYHAPTGTNVWITAGHCVADPHDDYNETEHEPIYQPNTSDFIGRFKGDIWYPAPGYRGYPADVAVVRKDGSGVGEKYDLASDSFWGDYEGWTIKGVTSWDRIKWNVGNSDFTVYQQGQASGRSTGTISSTSKPAYYVSGTTAKHGDSGGPHFEIVDGDAYIMGVISSGIDNVGATSAHLAESELSAYIGNRDL